jgi:hypothetical protein
MLFSFSFSLSLSIYVAFSLSFSLSLSLSLPYSGKLLKNAPLKSFILMNAEKMFFNYLNTCGGG